VTDAMNEVGLNKVGRQAFSKNGNVQKYLGFGWTTAQKELRHDDTARTRNEDQRPEKPKKASRRRRTVQ
jgi:hypothetical protein